ncbi:Tox-REase-5 domain-containing protein [uncultured Paracoccus sp.]|uniref:Tox-REase-5 domain-containing protein n=1 Tax=uncultured Paracoccus sp. TaxID=189685 RepID=UPI0025EF3E35|nr:Tox-REase-5 domain-containing protein [uncultured Paracoccus sp.]
MGAVIYQHWVCPWHAYDPPGGRIWEWNWFGVSFDGLHPAECHLFETKHGYDGFLKQDDWSPSGRPELQDWFVRSGSTAFADMIDQADRQHALVAPHYPKVRLTWVFSSMTTKLYLYEIFMRSRWVPIIETEVRPFNQGTSDAD